MANGNARGDGAGFRSAGVADEIFDTLRLAGYRLEDEREVKLGLTAYNAAALLRMTVEDTPRPSRLAGRNDPCPCGSGRKYKRCCLPEQERARAGATAGAGRRSIDPVLIPNLSDTNSMRCSLVVLDGLFERNPKLREVRYSGAETARFLERELDCDAVAMEEALDDLAQRYAIEAEPDVAGRLEKALVDAAPRAHGPDELRALALGVVLALAHETGAPGPNPLLCMLFRKSVREHMGALVRMEQLVDELGGRSTAVRKLRDRDAEAARRMTELAATLSPGEVNRLRESFDTQLDDAAAIIGEGRFPVGLPLVSLLPLLDSLQRMERDGPPAVAALVSALDEALAILVDEDLALFGAVLDRWLARDDCGDRALTSTVLTVRGLALGGDLGPLWRPLALSAVRTGTISLIDDDGRAASAYGGSPFSARFLERYARDLDDRGYPALARRALSRRGDQLELAFAFDDEDRSPAKRGPTNKRDR
jgi:hypothetical protein